MKRKSIICCLLVLAMCLSVFAACATNFDADTLQATITNIELEQYQITSTPASYQLDRNVETYDAKGNPATIYVKWTIEDSNLITITENGDTVTVNIPDSRVAVISYKLRATLTDANGKAYAKNDGTTYTAVFTRQVPIVGGDQEDNNGGNDNNDNQGGNNNDNAGGNQGVGPTAVTLDTTGTTNRTSYSTSQVVYSANGITYTQTKAQSPTDCYDAEGTTNATRAYFGSDIKIEYTSAISYIVLQCYGNNADPGDLSVAGFTITADPAAKTVTIEFNTPGTTFTATNLPKQLRIESITVYTSGTPGAGNQGGNGGNTGNTGDSGNTGGSTGGGDIGGGTVSGNTVTIVFENLGYASESVLTSFNSNGLTFTFSIGSNQNNAPRYYAGYNGDNALRMYGGNTMTISGKTITKVVFTFADGDGINAILVNTGTFTTDTWVGSTSSLTFTIDGASKHRKIYSMAITFAE